MQKVLFGGDYPPKFVFVGYAVFYGLAYVVATREDVAERYDFLPQLSHGAFAVSSVLCFSRKRYDLSLLLILTTFVSLLWHGTGGAFYRTMDTWLAFWAGLFASFSAIFEDQRAVTAISTGITSYAVTDSPLHPTLLSIGLPVFVIAAFRLAYLFRRVNWGYVFVIAGLIFLCERLYRNPTTWSHCAWHASTAAVTSFSLYILRKKEPVKEKEERQEPEREPTIVSV